jgi:Icc-related predicted phosphoesterase
MHIVLTSDLHGTLPDIPECDLLLIVGDVTPVWNHDRAYQADWLRTRFSTWLNSVPANDVVWVAGNHDFVLEESKKLGAQLPGHYLQDSMVEVAGLKIWGSPFSNQFGDWAFMGEEYVLGPIWEIIPRDIDILLTHGPAFKYGDLVPPRWRRVGEDPHVGSVSLAHQLENEEWPNLKVHAYGHIHEAYGEYRIKNNAARSLNVSLLDDEYAPTNGVVEIEL